MGKEKSEITVRIFALIIAIVLWSYVMSEVDPNTSKEINVNVNFINEASLERQGLVILDPESASVEVTISGRRSDVVKVSEEDIIAQVDLSGYSEGNVKVPVYLEIPNSVRIEDYKPKEILFTFDKIVSREIPITIEYVGEEPAGYEIGDSTAKPQYVVVEGPRTWLNSVSKVVASVDISEVSDDVNVTVPLRIVDDEGNDVRGISSNVNVADVSIPVYQIKYVPVELKTENQIPENYEIVNITINPSTIAIVGKKDIVKNISQISTSPIDILTLMNEENVVVDLDLPEGVWLSNPEEQVTVTLNAEEIITKTFEYTMEDVEILNLDPELNIETDAGTVFQVTVEGISSVIEPLEPEDISLKLDLMDLEEGSHTVSITVEEGEYSIVEILPETLDITLTKVEGGSYE